MKGTRPDLLDCHHGEFQISYAPQENRQSVGIAPFMIAMLAMVAWADCPAGPTNNPSLQRQVESAFFAFVELDDTGFEAYRSSAVQSVFCLEELIHPHLAAEFLRLEGVRAFTDKNDAFATAAFRAARTLEPNHRLPTTLAPPGGPLHTLYVQSTHVPISPWELPTGEFRTYVNGIPSSTAPNGIAVVQFVLADGTLPYSGILTRRDDLPSALLDKLDALRPVLVKSQPTEPGTGSSNRTSTGFSALVVGLAAGSLFGSAMLSRARYDSAPTKQRRSITNALTIGSAGAGALTLGLGVAAILPSGRRK